MQDDVAGKGVSGRLPKGNLRRESAAEIFFDHPVEAFGSMFLQRRTGIDLMARHAYFHCYPFSCSVRRNGPARQPAHSGEFDRLQELRMPREFRLVGA